MGELKGIPVVHMPPGEGSDRILRRIATEPIWDTEVVSGLEPVDFYQRGADDSFLHGGAAQEILGRSLKTRGDTNTYRGPTGYGYTSIVLQRHNRYQCSGVVIYPSTEGVCDVAAYARSVDRLRHSGTARILFGDCLWAEFPLADVMCGVGVAGALGIEEATKAGIENVDPAEAVGYAWRRGVDLEVALKNPLDESKQARPIGYPITVSGDEDFRIRVVPGAASEPVVVRCYLVGVHARALQ